MLQRMQHHCGIEHVLLRFRHYHRQISYFSWGINIESHLLLIPVRLLGFILYVRLNYWRISCSASANGGILLP